MTMLDLSKEPAEILKLADELHNLFCHSNHTDQCSFYYEKWDDVRLSSMGKLEAFLRACRLLSFVTPIAEAGQNHPIDVARDMIRRISPIDYRAMKKEEEKMKDMTPDELLDYVRFYTKDLIG